MDRPNKYVTFKAEEFWEAVGKAREQWGVPDDAVMLQADPLLDAHVIREQDIFAATVLFTYASSVQTAIEILQHSGQVPPDYLYQARDHFFDAAQAAEATITKGFPDE